MIFKITDDGEKIISFFNKAKIESENFAKQLEKDKIFLTQYFDATGDLAKQQDILNKANDQASQSAIKYAMDTKGTAGSVSDFEKQQIKANETLKKSAKSFDMATISSGVYKLAVKGVALVANMASTAILSGLVYAFSKLFTAQDEAIQKVKELNATYESDNKALDDYKEQINTLVTELNSSNLSYEESKTKRKELMSIQEELFKMYGTEEQVIKAVTAAINGEVDALDTLSQKSYYEWLASVDSLTWGQKFGNTFFQITTGISDQYKSALDSAVDYMEDKTQTFFVKTTGNAELDKIIQDKFGLYKNAFDEFVIKDTVPEEAYELLSEIRTAYRENATNYLGTETDNILSTVNESIQSAMTTLDTDLNKHQETYHKYLEGMIKYDSEYSDEYADLLVKRAELEEAELSVNDEGKKQRIIDAKKAFYDSLNNAIASAENNDNVKRYFENLYPDLYSEISSWDFEYSIHANTDNVGDAVKEIGEKYTATDLLGMLDDDSAVIADSAFSSLIDKAIEYGICTDKSAQEVQKLIDLLVELGYVQDNVKGDTFNNETPDFFTQLNNSKDSLDKFQSSVKSAYDAYSTLLSGNYSSNELLDSIQAINQVMSDISSEIQWESMLGGGIGLAQVQETLERAFQKYAESILHDVGIEIGSDFGQMLAHNIVNAQKASTQLEVLNDQIDSLQSAYSDLTDIVDTYNETGYITFDQLQKLLEMEPQYISCLVDENGQLQLNEQSMIALANKRLDDAAAQAIQQAITELGTLTLKDEQVAVEQNAEAFSDAINDLADYNEELANTIAEASVGAAVIRDLNAAISGAEENGASDDQINTVLTNLETKLQLIQNVRDQANKGLSGLGSVMKSSSSSSSSSTEDFEENFDWLETAIDRIERSISNLDSKASSVYRSWSERNSNLKAELADVKKEMDIQASGYNKYMQQAASVGLSEEWASKVRNGQIDSSNITDKGLADQIKQYQDYYEKALKCQDAVEDLRESVSKLYKTAFDNIVSQFDSIVSAIENSKSMLDEYINQAEERGYIANAAYYEALIKVEQQNIEQLTKERTSLQSALADAVNSGAIAEGSQEWADMVKQINDVSLSIEEANTAMLKYGNSIRDIQWQIFDLIQDRISRISSESDFLINLLSYDKQYDERGQLTDTGMSTVGLHGMNYNVYMAQADKYAQEMLRIDKELAKDPYNQDLAKRRQELLELQQEMIIAAEDEKQAIVDTVEEGINLELDALKELIDTYTEALDAQKDLYDYQKNIAKQTEEIASLQKQLSAYEGDLSEEARAKVQQLKVSLENAQEQLEETEYERYISDQKKLLDDLYLEYETALNQRLDNIDALIADMIASSNANAGMISDVLSSKADSVGYYLSESMEDIWNTNTDSMLDALAMYDSNVVGGFAAVNTSVGEVIRGVTETVSGIGNVNTTITNAINSVTANMQAILDRLSSISTMQSASAASSYYGGSGGTSSSGGSTSSSGSSTGNTGFFIYSKNSYPKDKLNIDTSIIDRLRYFDFDSSFSARQMYYSKMGLPGTYTVSA